MAIQVFGAAAFVFLGVRTLKKGYETIQNEMGHYQPLFRPYTLPPKEVVPIPLSLTEYGRKDGEQWLLLRRQELQSQGVRGEWIPGTWEKSFSKDKLDSYELGALHAVVETGFSQSEVLIRLLYFYVDCRDYKRELLPLFPLVDEVSRGDLEARERFARIFGRARRRAEERYLEAAIAEEERSWYLRASEAVEECVEVLGLRGRERLQILELLRTYTGLVGVIHYLQARGSDPHRNRVICAQRTLQEIYRLLLRDGAQARLNQSDRLPVLDQNFKAARSSTEPDASKPYLKLVAKILRGNGIPLGPMQLKTCPRCGQQFAELKTAGSCWDCWGN